MQSVRVLVCAAVVCLLPSAVAAQGIVWKLPDEDGVQVTYAGSYTQILRRAESSEQDVELRFNRELRVRSVGRSPMQWRGQEQPGRWIEFEQITRTGGAVQDVGPGGSIIVKLLVPEAFFDGRPADGNGIPKTAIPYGRGYQQRDGGQITPLPGGTFQPYPSITLVRMSKALEESSGTVRGEETVEGPESKVELETTIVRDEQAPFGVASWEVLSKQSTKRAAEPRDQFLLKNETTETMELKRVEDGVVSAIDRE